MVMNTPPLSQAVPPIPFANNDSSSPSSNSSNATATNSTAGGSSTVLKKGPWTAAEDAILVDYVRKRGEGNWNAVRRNSALSRCGKSCRLRWANHLRPNLKKAAFSPEEERLILELHSKLGNKWARMATQLPGRTDNEIKNYWNTRIKRMQRLNLPLYPPDIQPRHVAEHPSSHTQPRAATNKVAGAQSASIFNCFMPQLPFPCLDPQRVSSLSPATLIPAATQFKNSYVPNSRFEFSGPAFPSDATPRLLGGTPRRSPNGNLSAPSLDDLLRNATAPYDPDPLAGKSAFDFDVKPELPSSQSAAAPYTRFSFDGVAGVGHPTEALAPPEALLLPTTLAEHGSGLLDAMLQEAQGFTGNEASRHMMCDWTDGKDSGCSSDTFDVHCGDSRTIGGVEIKKETVDGEFHYPVDDEFPALLDFMSLPMGTSTTEWYGESTEGEVCNPPAEFTSPNPAPFLDGLDVEIQQHFATSLDATEPSRSLNSCAWTNMPGIC